MSAIGLNSQNGKVLVLLILTVLLSIYVLISCVFKIGFLCSLVQSL